MQYKYRKATPSDAPACAKILRDWGDETPWMVRIQDIKPLAAFWAGIFETDHGWVAQRGDTIVGFCARCDDNIAALYIAKDARNAGVGKGLLDLAKQDRDWITVWAYENNRDARRFYRREGLIEILREPEVFDDGSTLVDVEHRWTRSS